MVLESLLAYLHIAAILTLVVFISSEAALCRAEWLNAQVVERLVAVDRIYGISAIAVLATGLARIYFGVKGSAWYWGNWLLHLKLGAFVVVALISIAPTLRFIRWRRTLRATGALPDAAEVRAARKLVMLQAHIIPFIPLAAVFLARGFGARG
jgi:putative membrane protein